MSRYIGSQITRRDYLKFIFVFNGTVNKIDWRLHIHLLPIQLRGVGSFFLLESNSPYARLKGIVSQEFPDGNQNYYYYSLSYVRITIDLQFKLQCRRLVNTYYIFKICLKIKIIANLRQREPLVIIIITHQVFIILLYIFILQITPCLTAIKIHILITQN